MDHALAVGVLDGVADLLEQAESRRHVEPLLVAVTRDRNPVDKLHREVGPPVARGPGVEDLGDGGVLHERQRLPLGLEASDDLARPHPRLDQLERDAPPHGAQLIGFPDLAHPPLADRPDQPIRADRVADPRAVR